MRSNAKNTISTVIPAMRYRDANAAIEWFVKPSGLKGTLSFPARTEQLHMRS